MSIIAQYVPICGEILALPGVVAGPVLCWGVTDINIPEFFRKPWRDLTIRQKLIKLHHTLLHNLPWALPEEFGQPDLVALLRARGVQPIDVLDWFDKRANLRFDMNEPAAAEFHNRYGLFIDIGCLEHVFDTSQCIENCMRMVAPGGYYVLCTPVSGWVGHGFHTFDARGLGLALTLNGFEVVYRRYTSREGRILEQPKGDTLIWMVARKVAAMSEFKIPQQDYRWAEMFGTDRSRQAKPRVSAGGEAAESMPERARSSG